MANDRHVQGVRRGWTVLHIGNRARRDQHEDEHDQDRDDRPGQFQLITAVDLGRFRTVVLGTAAEADGGVGEQPADDEENPGADGQREPRNLRNQLGRRGERLEDVRDLLGHAGRGRSRQECGLQC